MSARLRPAEPGERTTSMLAVAVTRAGIRRGAKAAAVVVSWAVARADLGRELGDGSLTSAVGEYAAWWKMSERNAWRDLQAFKLAFPEEESPARLADLLGDVAGKRSEVLMAAPLLAVPS